MRYRRPRNSTFSIYVRFGKGRLLLKKGIGTIDEAREALRALRAERFHDADQLFLVDGVTGAEVQEVRRPRAGRSGRAAEAPAVTGELPLVRLERAIRAARVACDRYARAAAALEEVAGATHAGAGAEAHRLIAWTHDLHELGELAVAQLDGVAHTIAHPCSGSPSHRG